MGKTAKLIVMGAAVAALASADNIIKKKVDGGEIEDGFLDKNGYLEIEKHHNKGLPLNKLDKHTKEITALSTFVLGMHAFNTISKAVNDDDCIADISNTLIMAGALSNTYDRVSKGYVTDYLKVGKKKNTIYNISDFFIIGGAALALINAVKKP